MPTYSFKELIAWQKAMDFVVLVYKMTSSFPREEMSGLTAQLRRSAVSIPSNIAEGQGRQTLKDFLHFLSIAYGSLNEAETQILLGERLQFLGGSSCAELLSLASEVGRLVNGLSRSLTQQLTTEN